MNASSQGLAQATYVIELGEATAVSQLIRGTFANYAAALDKEADLPLKITEVHQPYPIQSERIDEERYCQLDLSPKHSVSLAFTLGYIAGSVGKGKLATAYEALLRTLETLSLAGLRYGLIVSPEEFAAFIIPLKEDHTYLALRCD